MIVVVDDDQESPAKYLTAVVTLQPADVVGVIGGQVQFTFTYAAIIPAVMSVKWQMDAGHDDWQDLVETAGFYEGVATTTLTVKAIDNFLVSQFSRGYARFRGKILFAGSVPTFTDAARVTVPIWIPLFWNDRQAYCVGYVGPSGGDSSSIQVDLGAAVRGLPGAKTYLWARVDGSALITNPAPTDPLFAAWELLAPPGLGIVSARWICTISNGINSVVTDPVYVVFVCVAADPDLGTEAEPVDGDPTEGATLSLTPPNSLNGAWTASIAQINLRCLSSAAISISTPNAAATGFTIPTEPSGGSATVLIGYVPCLSVGQTVAQNFMTQWGCPIFD